MERRVNMMLMSNSFANNTAVRSYHSSRYICVLKTNNKTLLEEQQMRKHTTEEIANLYHHNWSQFPTL
jgi:hypothetical protein